MTSWAEAGNGTLTSGSPPASMAWEYDLKGNIRRQNASYRSLDAQGTANGAAFTQDNWYRYDNMDRVTVEKGVLSKMWVLRRILNPMGTVDAMEFLLDKLKYSKTNNDFFDAMNT